MKILVANIGSTSFKYRLFDMAADRQLARGWVLNIGSPESSCGVEVGDRKFETTRHVPDMLEAVHACLHELTDLEYGCLKDAGEIAAIAFKAVHGGRVSGVQKVTPEVLSAMEEVCVAAPAHNPPYIRAMRTLMEKLPEMPLVAAFETDFHRTIPDAHRYYAVPYEWAEQGLVQRYGFHGASHRYIAERTAQLFCRSDLRIISCHLGGSSSLCAIRNGQSVATSMGFSPQTGLPNSNRVGDFDPFALPLIMKKTGKSLGEVLDLLATQSGLLGLSGISMDMRQLRLAAKEGNPRARLAMDVFAAGVRHYLGAYLVALGGADAIVFTAGIGEWRPLFRAQVCQGLEELGIVLDPHANEAAIATEAKISAPASRVQVWVVPTNEEIVVARQVAALLKG
jgi:acetate kinase